MQYIEQFLFALRLQHGLELRIAVEVILDGALGAAGDEDQGVRSGGKRFVDRILNERLVDDGEYLLRARLGDGKESRAAAGDGEYGSSNGFFVRHAEIITDLAGARRRTNPTRANAASRLRMPRGSPKSGKPGNANRSCGPKSRIHCTDISPHARAVPLSRALPARDAPGPPATRPAGPHPAKRPSRSTLAAAARRSVPRRFRRRPATSVRPGRATRPGPRVRRAPRPATAARPD